MLLLIAVAFFEKMEFVFDRSRQLVSWKKRTVFSSRSGSVRFNSIKSIVIQGVTDSDNNRNTRVAIITDKETLPLSKSYTGNRNQIIKIAQKLNQWVLDKNPDLVLESIEAALDDGRRIDAAITLRKAYSLSMTEAKQILDHPERLDSLPPVPLPVDELDINSGDKETMLGIAALITLVCGPLLLILGVNGYLHSVDTITWPTAEAVVIDSGWHREIESDEHEFYLTYSYMVNEISYQSNVLYIKPIMNEKNYYSAIPKFYLRDNEVVKPRDYQQGKTITIYYDPADPQSAVVIPGVSGSIWAMLVAGSLFTIIYLYLARRDLRRRALKKRRAPGYGTSAFK